MKDIYSAVPLDSIAGPSIGAYPGELSALLPWALVAAAVAVTICILVTLRRK